MKTRTVVYFDPETIAVINSLRGLTPTSIFVNHHIKQLGKNQEASQQIIQPAKLQTPKNIVAPKNKPITSLTILCPACHKPNLIQSRKSNGRKCVHCDYHIKKEDIKSLLLL